MPKPITTPMVGAVTGVSRSPAVSPNNGRARSARSLAGSDQSAPTPPPLPGVMMQPSGSVLTSSTTAAEQTRGAEGGSSSGQTLQSLLERSEKGKQQNNKSVTGPRVRGSLTTLFKFKTLASVRSWYQGGGRPGSGVVKVGGQKYYVDNNNQTVTHVKDKGLWGSVRSTLGRSEGDVTDQLQQLFFPTPLPFEDVSSLSATQPEGAGSPVPVMPFPAPAQPVSRPIQEEGSSQPVLAEPSAPPLPTVLPARGAIDPVERLRQMISDALRLAGPIRFEGFSAEDFCTSLSIITIDADKLLQGDLPDDMSVNALPLSAMIHSILRNDFTFALQSVGVATRTSDSGDAFNDQVFHLRYMPTVLRQAVIELHLSLARESDREEQSFDFQMAVPDYQIPEIIAQHLPLHAFVTATIAQPDADDDAYVILDAACPFIASGNRLMFGTKEQVTASIAAMLTQWSGNYYHDEQLFTPQNSQRVLSHIQSGDMQAAAQLIYTAWYGNNIVPC